MNKYRYPSMLDNTQKIDELEKIQLLRRQQTYGQKNEEAVITHYLDANLENGINVIGAHIDSPRMDIKQNPLYEKDNITPLHYIGCPLV